MSASASTSPSAVCKPPSRSADLFAHDHAAHNVQHGQRATRPHAAGSARRCSLPSHAHVHARMQASVCAQVRTCVCARACMHMRTHDDIALMISSSAGSSARSSGLADGTAFASIASISASCCGIDLHPTIINAEARGPALEVGTCLHRCAPSHTSSDDAADNVCTARTLNVEAGLMHSHTHACLHARKYARTHANACTQHTHTRTHTHVHAHTLWLTEAARLSVMVRS